MFKLSSYIALVARTERRYNSEVKYYSLYTLACLVRVIEVSVLLAVIILSIWILSFAF